MHKSSSKESLKVSNQQNASLHNHFTTKKGASFSNRLLSKSFQYLYHRRIYIILGVLLLFLIFLFFGFVKMIVILGSLVLLTVVLSYFCRGIPYVGRSFELIMFTTIIAGTVYGAKMGALFGLLTSLLYYYAAGRMSIHISVFAPLYALMGILASFLISFPIAYVGVLLTLLYTILTSLVVVLVFGGRIEKAVIFFVVNLFFNFLLFKYLAPIILMIA